MSKKAERQAEREEARKTLLEWIAPGDTVYCILDHVARSGMTRHIRLVVMLKGEAINGRRPFIHPNHSAARLLGYRQAKRDGLIVGGCGMDMGFHVVSSLSHKLFPKGFGCIGKFCPSNDHINGDRDYTPHTAGEPIMVNGGLVWDINGEPIHWHKNGDYAIRHEWL